MKFLPVLAATLALSGCASFDRLSYGSWLEHVGDRKAARYPLTADEAQALKAKASTLQERANVVRLKLAAEKDRVQRVAYYNQLEDIGDELKPIQKTLLAAGTNSRRYPPPPDYTQAGGQ